MTRISRRGRPPFSDILTPAEWRVVEGVRHGLTNPAIANRLGITPDAVKFHVANVLAKLGLSGRKELRTWEGIARASARGGAPAPDPDATFGAICQIARGVADIERARAWYGDTLGLPHLYSFGKLAFFDCGGTRLMLSEADGGPTASILYFRAADIGTEHKRLAARGINFTHAPHMIHRHPNGTEEWMAFFEDDEGRPLAIAAKVSSV